MNIADEVNKNTWNANLYDQYHSFVSKYGNDLVELLAAKNGERILDLGCGTGDIAKILYDKGIDIIGIDNSETMIQQAKVKYPEVTFLVKDATSLGYENAFDAVFSNATLHWVKTPEKALHSIFNSLKQGGRFVAEFGGKGNVQIITSEIINQIEVYGIQFRQENYPWFYPSIGQYSALMESVGFRVTYAVHFNRQTPLEGEDGLKNWINMFGLSLFNGIEKEISQLIISKVEDALKPILYKNGQWEADYKRIRVVGIKE